MHFINKYIRKRDVYEKKLETLTALRNVSCVR